MAKEMGGKPQPASGATPWAKEDVITKWFLVQHKDVKKTHTIKMMDLHELKRNAIDANRKPVYIIENEGHKFYVLGQTEWEDLLGYYGTDYEWD